MIRRTLGIFRKVVLVGFALAAVGTAGLWLVSHRHFLLLRHTPAVENPLVAPNGLGSVGLHPQTYLRRGLLNTTQHVLVDR